MNLPKIEEDIIKYWNAIDAFNKSLEMNNNCKKFIFYDGPPFATGLPHYGHILAGTIKDIVTRYAHQNGYNVARRFGFDCHGLPIEYEIEKDLGIKTKEEILELGIDKYNDACRKIVLRYAKQWETIITRTGRWIDFKNCYKTMDVTYMESVWYIFKQLYNKGLVYKGFKVMPYSTRCSTPLSNFEAKQNYKETKDYSIIIKFPLTQSPDTSFLVWTTTPWTLPSNMGLCVNPRIKYVTIKTSDKQKYIIAKNLITQLITDEYTIIDTCMGVDLKNVEYIPMFKYYNNTLKVHIDDYVASNTGTGVVQLAPAFGEDDFRVCLRDNVIAKTNVPCPINNNGYFIDPVIDFKGIYIKDAELQIIKWVKTHNRLFKREKISHQYPFCWRSDTPLIYKAVSSWFINVSSIADKLLKNTQNTYWVPDVVKTKRFINWISAAKDWAVSRNRFWGTPLPIWVSGDDYIVIGSIDELRELSGVQDITDLHTDSINDIVIKKDGKVYKRVPEVFDCWFESGSMPYAQAHYPFSENNINNIFPADFIAEGLDQTRGWFYTLLVLSTALFDEPAFKNVIVNGLILAKDGKKMSKRLKNYPEVMHIINKYGADVLRLYLINSPAVRAEPLKFNERDLKKITNAVFIKWHNIFTMFKQNANNIDLIGDIEILLQGNIFDRWLISYTQTLIKHVHQEMTQYKLYKVIPHLIEYINKLSNWHVRCNRERITGKLSELDQQLVLSVLYYVLNNMNIVMAPFIPFFTEYIHHQLQGSDAKSVHFINMPQSNEKYIDSDIEQNIEYMQHIIETIRKARLKHKIPVKHTLTKVTIKSNDKGYIDRINQIMSHVLKETNIESYQLQSNIQSVRVAKPVAKNLAPQAGKLYVIAKKVIEHMDPETIDKFMGVDYMYIEHIDDMIYININGHAYNTHISYDGPSFTLLVSQCDVNIVMQMDDKGVKTVDDSLVQLDLTIIKDKSILRELVGHIQQHRKKQNLNIRDIVTMQCMIHDNDVTNVIIENIDYIFTYTKTHIVLVDAQVINDYYIVWKQKMSLSII